MPEDFVDSLWDKKRIKDQLGEVGGNIIIVNKWKDEEISVYDDSFKIESGDIGDDLFLDHDTNSYISSGGDFYLGSTATSFGTTVISDTNNQLVTDEAIDDVSANIYGDTVTPPYLLAYGNGTDSFNITQTELSNEIDRFSNSDYPVHRTITAATGATGQSIIEFIWYINNFAYTGATEYGLFNDTTAGTMFTRRVETSSNFVKTKEYKITWTLKVKDL